MRWSQSVLRREWDAEWKGQALWVGVFHVLFMYDSFVFPQCGELNLMPQDTRHVLCY